jgi:UDP-N-acetylglucosamine--N-acetylmuramyl-(pentapeptide) pyrophosphoryl-undecaprenol N-acetylglucosamine transferase
MKVLFACGGSGGHVMPAIAMAEILKRAYPSTRFAFVGNENGMERRITAKEGYPFYSIAIEGLHRAFTFRNLRTLFLAVKAPIRARRILKDFCPSLVVGTGGYVSYPVIPCAARLGIPTLLYEPNAVPGLAVRMTEKHATRILLQFEECATHLKFRERTRVIGAPMREGFSRLARTEARARLGLPQCAFTVLVFGGSLGAEKLSRAVSDAIEPLGAQGVTLIHATGERLFDAMRVKHPREASEGRILPYIHDMACYMAAANAVVCRAGALTLAELSRLGRAAILIPSPYVAEDHQTRNARLYEGKGAALVLTENELCADVLCERILFLKRNPQLLAKMEKNAREQGRGDSAESFLAAIREILPNFNSAAD